MGFVDLKQLVGRRRLIVIGGVVIAAVAVFALWPSGQTPKPPGRPGGGPDGRPVPVVTAAVGRKDVPIYLDALGTVQAYNNVTVRSRVDGELVEVLFQSRSLLDIG